ncbi:MAG TPA: hypothetical protein ENI51_11120, partial [Candidatus Atribacteria bacterium]|nr:hypothetical protein [Candidatus Atribacteria bacterium]
MKSKKIGYLNGVIFIPEIPGIHKDYEFLMKVNQNELKLFNKDLVLVYTKNFEKNINSVQLLEKNKTNIFLVGVNNKIYYLDKCLNIKEEFSPDFEIKKVLSVWNNEEKTYNFIVQSDRSIYCYSSIMAKLWRYPINEDFDEEILSLSLTNNQFNIPIIFGNTKNEVFLVGLNGGEIIKKNFYEVFSVHPLSEGIVVYCYEPDASDEKKYVLKMIRFDDPKKENLNILYASNKPFNAVTSGSIQSDKPYMIFFQEGAEFMAINQNGTKYLENLIVLNFQVKKIIIEELDNMAFHCKFPDSRQHQENVSELALLCENEIIFCVPKLFVENSAIKMRFIEIDKHQIDGLDGFFIPERQNRFPKRAFYGVSD